MAFQVFMITTGEVFSL